MLCSEGHADFEADAPAVRVGIMKVGDAADVVDFDEFEVEVLSEKKKRSTNPYSFA